MSAPTSAPTNGPSSPARVWLAHGLGLVAAILLVGAGTSWLTGGAAVVGARTGHAVVGADAVAIAALAAQWKGLLDLWPLPLALVFAQRRAYRSTAAVWAVAVVVIPLADLRAALARGGAGAAVHAAYAAVLTGAALAYARVASRTRDA